MTSVEEENKKIDIDEIDLVNLDEKNNSNQQNNSEEMNNIETENKKEKSIEDINENKEKKEILSNENDEKNNEKEKAKDEDEDGKDYKSVNKEIKNKSEIKSSQVNSGNQNHDNNNKSDKELKNDVNIDIEKESKNKNEKMLKDALSPSYSKISYRPSEFRSILQNTELSESDKLLLEKYTNYKRNSFKIKNNDLSNNLSFIKRLTYNYQNSEEPKTLNCLSKYKNNTIEANPRQYLNNNYIRNSKTLLEYENEKPKTYLERNNLIINDIGKDFNFPWDNIDYKPDKKIGRNNSEKILFTNSLFERDITNSYKLNKNAYNQDYIKNLKGDFSNKNDLNKGNEDFKLNFNYSYNISRNPDKNSNLLNKTSLINYHIPHTQSSIMKKYMPNYSIFDFHRYNYNQNMNNNDAQYNNNCKMNDNNSNYKCVLNYENKNLNNTNTNYIINNKNKSLDKNIIKINQENQNSTNKINQSIKGNENPFINKITNSKRFSSNSSIPKYNSKKYKSLLFNDDKKGSFISNNKNTAKNFNNKLFQPYQNYSFQNNLNKNPKYDLIIRNKKGGAFRDDKKEIKKNSSPSDFYYNTLHHGYNPKTQYIGRNSKPQFSKTYQIDENKELNNRKNLFYFSSIRRDLIDKNKRKSFKKL